MIEPCGSHPNSIAHASVADWRAWSRDRQRISARAVLFARKTGLEKRPCICGRSDVQMHHPDYTRPLEVGFLCSRCHTAEHWGRLGAPFEVHDLRWLAVENMVAFA